MRRCLLRASSCTISSCCRANFSRRTFSIASIRRNFSSYWKTATAAKGKKRRWEKKVRESLHYLDENVMLATNSLSFSPIINESKRCFKVNHVISLHLNNPAEREFVIQKEISKLGKGGRTFLTRRSSRCAVLARFFSIAPSSPSGNSFAKCSRRSNDFSLPSPSFSSAAFTDSSWLEWLWEISLTLLLLLLLP